MQYPREQAMAYRLHVQMRVRPWKYRSRTMAEERIAILAVKTIEFARSGRMLRDELTEPIGLSAYALLDV